MRTTICLFLIATATLAAGVPITRLDGVTLKTADLEKARQFYTGHPRTQIRARHLKV